MQTMRAVLALSFAAAMSAAVSARAAASALENDANREAIVVWYTTLLDEASKPLAAAFEQKYPGVKVEVTRFGSSDMLREILKEASIPRVHVDVFDGTTTADALVRAKVVQPWIAPSSADIPARYKDRNGYWTAQVLYFQTLGYNADLVPENEAPKTYADLLDPKWKGKLAWSIDEDSLTGGMGFIANILRELGEDSGTAYLRALQAQDVAEVKGGIGGVTLALVDKQFPIGVAIDNHHTVIADAKGAHVRWIAAPPVLALSNNIGLMADAPHPNAGMLLIEFNLSVEGQTILRNANHVPASTKVDPIDPSLRQVGRENYVSPADAGPLLASAQRAYAQIWKMK
jgi:iron(III) transport system substrate-binding protein